MKMFLILLMTLVLCQILWAQDAVKSDVHLFQTFLRDAPISSSGYGEFGVAYLNYDFLNQTSLGLQGGYPINEKIEIDVGLGFLFMNPDFADNQSGLSDIAVTGRYLIVEDNKNLSAGGYLTLPVGSNDLWGQNRFNFGAFAAIRQPLNEKFVFTGVLGLDFLEIGNDHEAAILINIGTIYAMNEKLHLVGELKFQSRVDYVLLSGGADYSLNEKGRIRGALGFGLDDGAPDFMIMGSYMLFLR
ncbi:MAG: transporter [bacterium]|nr:MAG: transporter [bacterium]